MGASIGTPDPGADRVNWTSGTATAVLLTGRSRPLVGSTWNLAGAGGGELAATPLQELLRIRLDLLGCLLLNLGRAALSGVLREGARQRLDARLTVRFGRHVDIELVEDAAELRVWTARLGVDLGGG